VFGDATVAAARIDRLVHHAEVVNLKDQPGGVRSEGFDTGAWPDGWHAEETKASFKTTELWAAIVGVVVLVIVYNASSDLSLDLFRACLLCTVLGASYIVSRGIAKSGSRPEAADWDGRTRR
jgi:hypothetical protein